MDSGEFIACFLGSATGTVFVITAMKVVDIFKQEMLADKLFNERFDNLWQQKCDEAAAQEIRIINESPDLMPCIKENEDQKMRERHINRMWRKA
ncbi:MAG: hypothetical protein K2Y22_04380 [Candidatus Obscuribacterales bacterium]|nr:hypothetical protein [Candidatus Obscuribacterales bacterium]